MAGRPSSRAQVLDAAAELVAEIGARHLTLDAVAARAGVSKGGLLYNFPSKESLLQAMVQRFVDRQEEREREAMERLPEGPNRTLRAVLAAQLERAPMNCKAAHSMLAAMAENPQLLEPARCASERAVAAIAQESEAPDVAVVLWLAMEGLLLQEILGTSPFDGEQRRQVVEAILRAAEGK
ncbi:TetR/AcrR family transcriptional regulator [Arenibaculum sp.]|uniref:TetR/AcrR family transcriptional regulator n=1 Tax=Arenibaculum sp. TaxID=2865862 RepID=UPI002E11F7AB|nr:TetR/AcrR family transcriptional regulator [Arenibaculum sp.]